MYLFIWIANRGALGTCVHSHCSLELAVLSLALAVFYMLAQS